MEILHWLDWRWAFLCLISGFWKDMMEAWAGCWSVLQIFCSPAKQLFLLWRMKTWENNNPVSSKGISTPDHQPQWEHLVTPRPCGTPSHSWLFLLLFRQSYTHSALLPSALGIPSSHPLLIHASFPCPSSFLFFLFSPTFHLLPLKLPSNNCLVFSGSPVPPLHFSGPTTAPSSHRQALPCLDTAVWTLFMPQIPSFLRLCGSWGLGTASSWQAEVIGVEMRWSSCSVLNTDCQSCHNRWWF